MKLETSSGIKRGEPCSKCKKPHESIFRGRLVVVRVCPDCKSRLCLVCLEDHKCAAKTSSAETPS